VADRVPLRDRFVAALASRLIQLVFVAVGASSRVRLVAGAEHVEAIRAAGRPALFVFWHDRMLLGSYFVLRQFQARGHPIAVLNSPSRDGEIGSRLVRYFGGESVRGSTTRGGTAAARALLRAVARGRGLMMMPDGPRGPAHQVKPGVVTLAQLGGIPIVPISWAADRGRRLRSWDRMEIPGPFARVRLAVGEPIVVPRQLGEDDLERHVAGLASILDDLGDLTRRAVV
jgi:hypothetical protein